LLVSRGEVEGMDKPSEQILDRVRKVAKDGKISCAEARKVAAELKVPPIMVGKAADELGVKIFACELGCF
jgi:hypothetical protein